MRILIISDIHFIFFDRPSKINYRIRQIKKKHKIDLTISLGDMTQGTGMSEIEAVSVKEFLQDPNLYYVYGNHDLWGKSEIKLLKEGLTPELFTPAEQFDKVTAMLKDTKANLLETSMGADKDTFYKVGDTLVVGSMGFPDFDLPLFKIAKNFWDKNASTNDQYHFDISQGWCKYSEPLVEAFRERLLKALTSSEDYKSVIVCTHYPILDGQSFIGNDNVSPYYFTHGIGKAVREYSKKFCDKQFYCFCGHSHDMCRGNLNQVENNVHVYGVQAQYKDLRVFMVELVDGKVVGEIKRVMN
jgi:predicted MPP superfamily phosphohydrolase